MARERVWGGGGGNRMGFGNTESDQLIEEIRTTLDPQLRDQLMLKFQLCVLEFYAFLFYTCIYFIY